MSNSDQDILIKRKFEDLLKNIDQLLKSKEEIDKLFPKEKKKSSKDVADAPSPFAACWGTNLHGRLAAIILCDQMSRCMYRGTKEAFHYDEYAIKLAKELVSTDTNRSQLKYYKHFELLYALSPLLHSESMTDVALYR